MPRAAKEKPEKKEKKAKDPNAPKKPMGAYMWFCKEMRESVKADNPDFSVTDIGRRLGELWKECEEEDKKKFHKMAEEDKDRYNKENAAYQKKAKSESDD
ncbi:hypothetical protein HYH02_012538 [Chlamydomonas schloesseri]|uniref:HMG box domain-containing protein n=1 Tax=Chlamydomonas schloesseri TaxID=2026947 RepID=A0A835T4D1_9CHLO|nr:hypothetical protein HYH02_012538 [Chlamydomonas schloesseri]|eukprot:KAG2433609.1 hypothetical protein HYH02_012538 [Chlamydomonas schloesseri]